MAIFVAATLFTSALYYGWQQYQKMLFQDGAYSWLCPMGEQCKEQEDAISRLYSIAAGCEYASAAIGGMFLDHLGPRRSGLIGEVTWAIGTFLLAMSSHSFQSYIPAMIIIGSSVNIVCFPALTTIETFPAWQGLMVGVVLGAQNAATGIPPLLYSIMRHTDCSLRTIWLVYLAVVWLPITILYILALPGAHDFKKMLKLQRQQLVQDEPTEEVEATDIIEGKASWKAFGKNLANIDMLVMAIYFATMMLIYAYYPTVVAYAISDEISDFMAYAMPTQAFWALCVGVIADWFCTAYLMIGMCLFLEMSFILTICATCPTGWEHYLACSILVISQCAIFEVKYTYVAEMFDPYNFGKLVGFLGVVGGCATFLNIPVVSTSNYRTVFIIYCSVLPVCAALTAFLRWRQLHGVTYKTVPETKSENAAALLQANIQTHNTACGIEDSHYVTLLTVTHTRALHS
ncbi:major facilitator family transporter [Gregarina niphandrodes]|uniref:Major facilitator family transporter n=1 Tax=Gregarina niphandrodes TaxID=110365 RepID=A0A023BAL8_GRENI|nr:major facilitator family transporter [Gregarina niphandrodes]EZG78430.1 major facilitator family transporter [Gregarina niphandrodes]|eukprot:XP_011129304.1 major facilitator family transporter [Gregarina niphandrodes]